MRAARRARITLVLVTAGLQASCGGTAGSSDGIHRTLWIPVAVNDLDGDGHVDFALILSPEPERPGSDFGIAIVSGLDGSVLVPPPRLPSGPRLTVAPADDLDGDAHPDLLVGIPSNGPIGGGRVVGISGRSFEPLWEISSWTWSPTFASQVVGVYDATQRRTTGVIVIDSMADEDGGLVSLYSAASRDRIATFALDERAPSAQCLLLEDVDRDHVSDLALGFPFALGGGRVFVLSGRNLTKIFELKGKEGEFFGSCLAQASDLDADGTMDLLVGAPGIRRGFSNAGGLYVCSGTSGSFIEGCLGNRPSERVGDRFCVHQPGETRNGLELASVDRHGRLQIHDLETDQKIVLGTDSPPDPDWAVVQPLTSARQGLDSGYVVCVNRVLGDPLKGPIADACAQVRLLDAVTCSPRGNVDCDALRSR